MTTRWGKILFLHSAPSSDSCAATDPIEEHSRSAAKRDGETTMRWLPADMIDAARIHVTGERAAAQWQPVLNKKTTKLHNRKSGH